MTESYRETIQRTVEHFTGRRVTRVEIQDWKNRGGWNDDWALSHRLIRDAGVDVDYQAVVDYFNGLFHGNGSDGLILRERWIASKNLPSATDAIARYLSESGYSQISGDSRVLIERYLSGASDVLMI